ncbi:MAG: hypothetical protein J7K84_01590, partial [Deltaproteobacteria bacterium]|nr:hypothetical protein [Deltaproteobacteria bacterium]
YSDCEVIDAEGNKIHDSIIRYTNKRPFSGKCFKELFLGIFIPVQGVMVKKKVFDKIGFFNENLVGTEDYEMWLRISYYYPIAYLNKSLAKWREHPTSLSNNQFQMDESFVNCLEFILNQFSDCNDLVGKENVKKRMYALSTDAAFQYLQKGDWSAARKWLKKTWHFGRKPKSLIHILMTYCTPIAQRHWLKGK